MCGIFAIFNYKGNDARLQAIKHAAKLRHRGPDWCGARVLPSKTPGVFHALSHERLMIVGTKEGWQPFHNGRLTLTINGEIYNHMQLRTKVTEGYEYAGDSDCEVILPLYQQFGKAAVDMLDGMYSFALHDLSDDSYLIARDHMGITSLYHGWTADGAHAVASELKALTDICESIEVFPPGHYYSSSDRKLVRYYEPVWWDQQYLPTATPELTKIHDTLTRAVEKMLMADVPYGVLLSGGLDSSLVASIASRLHRERQQALGLPPTKLQTFAIGLYGAPDLEAAQVVADFIGTQHHNLHFTVEDGHDALPDVIYHLESYDVTTIRASTPMYLLSRKVKSMGIKMVLSGEGSDEIFGGYLYFHRAPTPAAMQAETVMRVKNLHTSDCLRANKSTLAWGLEARVPFLDRDFLDTCLTVDPASKMHTDNGQKRIEKHLLRAAFDSAEQPYLPKHMLWRQKEQFSDGVGYSWIDSLKALAEKNVTDDQLVRAPARFPFDPPKTKEAYFYRQMFEKIFPQPTVASTVVNWVPKQEWGCSADPSGRAQAVHQAAL